MKGHIRERGKGNWWAVLESKDPATGKRKRDWQKLEAKGKREAQDECAVLIAQKKHGTYMKPSKTTLREFFDRWLPHIKPNVELSTYERYEELALKNIAPLLGESKLTELSAETIRPPSRPLFYSGVTSATPENRLSTIRVRIWWNR